MLDLSVVIPTHNRREVLRHVLGALLRQTYPADRFEVVVVDDGSTDGTRRMVEGLAPAGRAEASVRYVAQDPSKKGPAAANNAGIREAAGEIILFLNDDVVAAPQLVTAHATAHRRYPSRVIQGRVRQAAHPEALCRQPRGFREYPEHSLATYFVTWNCSVARQALIDAGLFNEAFVAPGWEDTELGYRLRRRGVSQHRCPNALGYHIKPDFHLGDLDRLREKTRQSAANALVYSSLHPSLVVRFSTQAWWLPRELGQILGVVVRGVGARRVRLGLAWLDGHDWTRGLAVAVWAARYYWYLQGIANERPSPVSVPGPGSRQRGLR